MGKRIREVYIQQVPVMLIMGDKDVEGGTVSVRRRSEGDLGVSGMGMSRAKLLKHELPIKGEPLAPPLFIGVPE